jgi:hypothetical protein
MIRTTMRVAVTQGSRLMYIYNPLSQSGAIPLPPAEPRRRAGG